MRQVAVDEEWPQNMWSLCLPMTASRRQHDLVPPNNGAPFSRSSVADRVSPKASLPSALQASVGALGRIVFVLRDWELPRFSRALIAQQRDDPFPSARPARSSRVVVGMFVWDGARFAARFIGSSGRLCGAKGRKSESFTSCVADRCH